MMAAKETARQSTFRRIARLIHTEVSRDNRIAANADKMRIANIAAQQLHIYTADQMTAFCAAYWAAMETQAQLARVTAVTPREPGKRDRRGKLSVVTSVASSP